MLGSSSRPAACKCRHCQGSILRLLHINPALQSLSHGPRVWALELSTRGSISVLSLKSCVALEKWQKFSALYKHSRSKTCFLPNNYFKVSHLYFLPCLGLLKTGRVWSENIQPREVLARGSLHTKSEEVLREAGICTVQIHQLCQHQWQHQYGKGPIRLGLSRQVLCTGFLGAKRTHHFIEECMGPNLYSSPENYQLIRAAWLQLGTNQ